MNKARRKMLDDAIELLAKANDMIEQIKYEEENAFYNMPESLQSSERGEKMEDTAYKLGDVYDSLDDLIDDLTEVLEEA